jgi:hypothetical protein
VPERKVPKAAATGPANECAVRPSGRRAPPLLEADPCPRHHERKEAPPELPSSPPEAEGRGPPDEASLFRPGQPCLLERTAWLVPTINLFSSTTSCRPTLLRVSGLAVGRVRLHPLGWAAWSKAQHGLYYRRSI